jgi:hypothetical protein
MYLLTVIILTAFFQALMIGVIFYWLRSLKVLSHKIFFINIFVLITKSVLFVKPLIVFKFLCKSFLC